jgi:hypothetical protein
MSPLVGLVLSIATLLVLMLAVVASDVSSVIKVLFVVLVAGGVGLAVARYREQR